MDELVLGGHRFTSRLVVGTGKYKEFPTMKAALEASGAQMVTVAVRRLDLQAKGEASLLHWIPKDMVLLPNTAGCYTADDAVRTCRLARELQLGGENPLVKLEVLSDPKTLLPDVEETLKAARQLVAEGFRVLPYTNDDPVAAKKLEDAGCAAVMPLGAPIGSGLGLRNPYSLQMILDQAKVPVIVDAGVGTASDCALCMELGVSGLLVNTAIAGAKDPVGMARAIKLATEGGRLAYLAGRIPKKLYGSASSPRAVGRRCARPRSARGRGQRALRRGRRARLPGRRRFRRVRARLRHAGKDRARGGGASAGLSRGPDPGARARRREREQRLPLSRRRRPRRRLHPQRARRSRSRRRRAAVVEGDATERLLRRADLRQEFAAAQCAADVVLQERPQRPLRLRACVLERARIGRTAGTVGGRRRVRRGEPARPQLAERRARAVRQRQGRAELCTSLADHAAGVRIEAGAPLRHFRAAARAGRQLRSKARRFQREQLQRPQARARGRASLQAGEEFLPQREQSVPGLPGAR